METGGDFELPLVFSRDEAHRRGLTDRQIEQRLRTGVWVALRPGMYRVASQPSESAEVVAALRRVGGGEAVASHASAARRWGLPRPRDGWGDVTLTVAEGSTRKLRALKVLVAPLEPQDIRGERPCRYTSPAQAVADCLRTLTPWDSLAMADAAVHDRLTSREEIGEVLSRQAGWPGAPRAREVHSLVDGRRESPLESWSAWAFHLEGLDQPQWQTVLATAGRTFVARVDSWWAEGLVGEADGRTKYLLGAAERRGSTAAGMAEVLAEERERERLIRRLGVEVVRWGSRDLFAPGLRAALVSHIRDLRASSTTRTFRGLAVATPEPAPLMLTQPTS